MIETLILAKIMGWDGMLNNYEERLIANTKNKDFTVDTVRVTDKDQPYETAVMDTHYYSDNWIIVERTDTKEDAQKMHNKWVAIMKSEPDCLEDIDSRQVFLRRNKE